MTLRFQHLCLLTLVALSCSQPVFGADPPPVLEPITSKLRPTEMLYDFGNVGIEYDLFHTFRFVNTSTKPITFDTATATCDCSIALLEDSIAAPGDTIAVRLKYNTKNYYGPTTRSLLLVTDEPSRYKVYYTSDVGQWPQFARPEPAALFFLPTVKSLPVTFHNNTDLASRLVGFDKQDTVCTVAVIKDRGRAGQPVQLTVDANPNLKKGTYHTNIRLSFLLGTTPDTAYVTVPVKIVRY